MGKGLSPEKRKLVVVTGFPGVGKTTFLKNSGYPHVNIDEVMNDRIKPEKIRCDIRKQLSPEEVAMCAGDEEMSRLLVPLMVKNIYNITVEVAIKQAIKKMQKAKNHCLMEVLLSTRANREHFLSMVLNENLNPILVEIIANREELLKIADERERNMLQNDDPESFVHSRNKKGVKKVMAEYQEYNPKREKAWPNFVMLRKEEISGKAVKDIGQIVSILDR
jgi:dephospho-CoA kinase